MYEILILLLFWGICTWLLSSPFYWKIRKIPSSLPWPLVGHTSPIITKSLREFWEDFYFKWKGEKYVGFHYFTRPTLMIRDPEIVRRITSSDHFLSTGMHTTEEDPISSSVLFLSGERWRRVRSKLTPSFSPARIRRMLPLAEESLDILISKLKEVPSGGSVDVNKLTVKMATDIVTKVSFGLDTNPYQDNSLLLKIQSELMKTRTLLVSLLGITLPWLYEFFNLKWLSNNFYTEMTKVLSTVIDNREKGIGVRPDFFQGMIDLKNKESQKILQTDPKNDTVKFKNETIVAQGLTLFLAGTETVGNTLSFALYELALHQDVQEKVRQEVISVSLKSTDDRYDQVVNLHYTNMVINEVLRKYPVIPVISRECTKPYTLDNLDLKKGIFITVPIIGLHWDPKYFPDPERFDPERFSSDRTIIPGTYMPFGHGPRQCLGMRFGLMNLCLSLSVILPQFRVTPCSRTETPLQLCRSSITASPNNGIWLSVQPLK